VFVPLTPETAVEDVAAATRALAARAERLDPALATTAFIREDRGARFSWTRPGPAGRRCGGLQPAAQARVPGPFRGWPGMTSTA